MQRSSIWMRLGSMLLLAAAGFTGLIAHYLIFVLAIGGGPAFLAIVAAKAILALLGGYLSVRALRMSRSERLILLGFYDLVPLLMPVLAAVPAWLLLVLPDLAAVAVGVALAREVDRRLVPARS
jgi:hypothetical protein